MSKQKITGPNAQYQKKQLIKLITEDLKQRTVGSTSWEGLPDCDESYLCLNKLNKTILIKIYECLMGLD